MGWRSKDKESIQEHRDARKALEETSRRDRRETDAYHEANRRVIDTEKNVSWWRR